MKHNTKNQPFESLGRPDDAFENATQVLASAGISFTPVDHCALVTCTACRGDVAGDIGSVRAA